MRYRQELSHPDEIWTIVKSSGWLAIGKSSGWLRDQMCYHMTWGNIESHPDDNTAASLSHRYEIRPGANSSGWHNGSIDISSGWLIADALCHPDDLAGVDISSGWVTANSLCHPDDIPFHLMPSEWVIFGWLIVRTSYGNVIMSSEWGTLTISSHPEEIANFDFDFSQHAVALQRFHNLVLGMM